MSPDLGQQQGPLLKATVTHLQMKQPPATYPPAPVGQQLALLKCSSMPLHFYRYLYDRVGRDWYWTAALMLSDAQLAERLASQRTDIRVLNMDGCPAGFFELRLLAEQECRLVHFGLMEHAIGRGLGRWFLGTAIHAAWSQVPAPRLVSVETCTLDHPAALALYQKMGFTAVWRREERLRELNPEERASVLLKS